MFNKYHIMMAATVIVLPQLSQASLFNWTKPSPEGWYHGRTPSWVKDCQKSEKNRELELLGNMNDCTSKGYTGYKDDLGRYSYLDANGRYLYDYNYVKSVHVVVTDAKLDTHVPDYGSCRSSMCYRAYVYINGDEDTGEHVATWVTTPGMPWHNRSGGNYTPESLYVYQTSPAKNQTSQGYFLLQKDDEMGLAGKMTNKMPGYYVMDHYVNSDHDDMPWATFYHYGIAFHSSHSVNGDVGSHGCTRLKYIEAKKMNFLARHVGRNFSVETRFTERKRLTYKERELVRYQHPMIEKSN